MLYMSKIIWYSLKDISTLKTMFKKVLLSFFLAYFIYTKVFSRKMQITFHKCIKYPKEFSAPTIGEAWFEYHYTSHSTLKNSMPKKNLGMTLMYILIFI